MTREWRVLTAPPYEPVSLTEAKLWCRVEHDDEDTLFELLIKAARERAEEITGRAFVKRRMELVLSEFPDDAGAIRLPFAPLIAVEYINYIDLNGNTITMGPSPSEFREILSDSGHGLVEPLFDTEWPDTKAVSDAVRVGFSCGYPVTASPQDEAAHQEHIPALLKQWMEVRINTFYEQREALVVGTSVQQPPRDFVDGLLDGLKVDFGFA